MAEYIPIVFVDMQEREIAERNRLRRRRDNLVQKSNSVGLGEDEERELLVITMLLAIEGVEADLVKKALELILSGASSDEVATVFDHPEDKAPVLDPFFIGLAKEMAKLVRHKVAYHVGGRLPTQLPGREPRGPVALTDVERSFAAVFGLLQLERRTDPNDPRFADAVAAALGEYSRTSDLFDRVLGILADEGLRSVDLAGAAALQTRNSMQRDVSTEQWAGVVRILRDDGVVASDRLLVLKTRNALANYIGVDEGGPPSSLVIDLPNLEAAVDVEILADNLHAMQAMYFCAMLDEVRLFQVVDKLVDLFQRGMLPFGKGPAGDLLYAYWKSSSDRIAEPERRNMYARSFGFPGGDPASGTPNREFNDLWLRFLSAVSAYVRQFTVDNLLRSSIPVTISQEQMRKAGRDLGANLSLHGYGITYFVATELQKQVNKHIQLLSDEDVKSAFGARDMWQVIDQVATLELGGARNSVRYRTMATSGAIVIRWLANHARDLASPATTSILNLEEIRSARPSRQGHKPMVNPTDSDLVNAVEQWLAVTGTPEARVEQYSQPVESPNMTAAPIRVPAMARDLLSSVGIAAGMDPGTNGNGNGYGSYSSGGYDYGTR